MLDEYLQSPSYRQSIYHISWVHWIWVSHSVLPVQNCRLAFVLHLSIFRTDELWKIWWKVITIRLIPHLCDLLGVWIKISPKIPSSNKALSSDGTSSCHELILSLLFRCVGYTGINFFLLQTKHWLLMRLRKEISINMHANMRHLSSSKVKLILF